MEIDSATEEDLFEANSCIRSDEFVGKIILEPPPVQLDHKEFNKKCKRLDPLKKKDDCRDFIKSSGHCPRGESCRYFHPNLDDIVKPQSFGRCYEYFVRGFCNLGSKCLRSHTGEVGKSNISGSHVSIAESFFRQETIRVLDNSSLYFDISSLFIIATPASYNSLGNRAAFFLPAPQPSKVAEWLGVCFFFVQKNAVDFLGHIQAGDGENIVSQVNDLLARQYGVGSDNSLGVYPFHGCFIPLLYLLSHKAIENAVMKQAANRLYALCSEHINMLMHNILFGLKHFLQLKDPSSNGRIASSNHLNSLRSFNAYSFAQLFAPCVKTIEILFRRFPETAAKKSVSDGMAMLGNLLGDWREFMNDIANQNVEIPVSIESDFAFQAVRRMFSNALFSLEAGQDIEAAVRARLNMCVQQTQEKITIKTSTSAYWVDDKIEPPNGTLHDNDFLDYRSISIIPTMQEIMCSQPPVLPGNIQNCAFSHWLPPGPNRLLDTHFRLLREDMLASMRGGVSALRERISENPHTKYISGRLKCKDSAKRDVDLMIYANVGLRTFEVDERHGLCISLYFQRPREIKNMDSLRRFYETSLQHDNLVFILSYPDVKLTCDRPLFRIDYATVVRSRKPEWSPNDTMLHITLKTIGEINQVVSPLINSGHGRHTVYIVEMRSLMFESYRPILRALQERLPAEIPFRSILCPGWPSVDGIRNSIKPPMFCRQPGFYYNLNFLKNASDYSIRRSEAEIIKIESEAKDLFFFPETSIIDDFKKRLVDETTLDDSQAHAMLLALSKKVSCIQGPPGTGKTYLGVKIVEALYKSKKGPILVLSYTNHALDQFLESIEDSGIRGIVRVGSKPSERMGKYQLERFFDSKRRDQLNKTKCELQEYCTDLQVKYCRSEKDRFFKLHQLLYSKFPFYYNGIGSMCQHQGVEGNYINYWLYACFDRKDGKGKTVDQKSPDGEEVFTTSEVDENNDVNLVNQGRTIEELLSEEDPWLLNKEERKAVHSTWMMILDEEREYSIAVLKQRILNLQLDRRELEAANKAESLRLKPIIGMTTTGAARVIDVVHSVAPKVLICEEAGEILEAHLIASLVPSIEQLILIGDHKQLRPKIYEYDLSTESRKGSQYRLDVSLFQRLVEDSPIESSCRLNQQRRMRPEISQFVRGIMYPDLKDGKNTLDRPDIRGLSKNIFFWKHDANQDARDETFGARSHSNLYEARMICQLVKYLVQQRYNYSQITVITPYLGQLKVITRLLEELEIFASIGERDLVDLSREDIQTDYERFVSGVQIDKKNCGEKRIVRVCTVDNYQGEECDIILISTVRSTFNGRTNETELGIGFLKTENRVNVMLSRARIGMYLVGNAEFLAAKSKVWEFVVTRMKEQNLVDSLLPILCQNHQDNVRYVDSKSSTISMLSPDGGCLEACETRLSCGHICDRHCHIEDPDHKEVRCRKDCERRHEECDHRCEKRCYQECGECLVPIEPGTIIIPECKHVYSRTATCYQSKYPAKRLKCIELVDKENFCGHSVNVSCYLKSVHTICSKVCNDVLSCGHLCSQKCGKCKKNPDEKAIHSNCNHVCEKGKLICGHDCAASCAEHVEHNIGNTLGEKSICPPCKMPCLATSCAHGKCGKSCRELCIPCMEPCVWSCTHRGCCSFPCGAPCNRLPCDKRCELKLSCGHQCPTICGEECPTSQFCHVCGSEENREQNADLIEFKTFSEVDPSETPVIILSCGHICTAESLDGFLELQEFYELDSEKNWINLKELPCQTSNKTPRCPNCRCQISVKYALRYGRLIKDSMFFISNAHATLAVKKRINDLQTKVDLYREACAGFTLKSFISNERSFDDKMNGNPSKKLHIGIDKLIKQILKSPGKLITDAMKNVVENPQNTIHEKKIVPCADQVAKTGIMNQFGCELGKVHQLKALVYYAQMLVISKTTKSRQGFDQSLDFMKNARKSILSALEVYSKSKSLYAGCRAVLMDLDIIQDGTKTIMKCFSCKWYLELIRKKQEAVIDKVVVEIDSSILQGKKHLDIIYSVEDIGSGSDYFSEIGVELKTKIVNLEILKNELEQNPINVSIDEIKMVIKALSKDLGGGEGHWYRCPNGHLYAIGNCGQAMETSRCPECNEVVGGSHHRLSNRNYPERNLFH